MLKIEPLCISSFQSNRSSCSKIQTEAVFGDHNYTLVENTVLVCHDGAITKNIRILLPSNIRGGSRATATSKMELFVIIVNGWKPLTIIIKRSILDVTAALDSPLNILSLPSKRSEKHPPYLKMKLFIVHLSGKTFETESFQDKLQILSQIRGEQSHEVDKRNPVLQM